MLSFIAKNILRTYAEKLPNIAQTETVFRGTGALN